MRFPELSLKLAQAGAEILTYPSAFGSVTGPAHWEVRECLFITYRPPLTLLLVVGAEWYKPKSKHFSG
jgi:hypothetical protein